MRGGWDEKMKATAKKLWVDGMTAELIAERCGVSRNSIVGLAHRNGWDAHGASPGPAPTTLFTRLDAAHAKMNAVLAQPRPKTWIPESEKLR